MPTQSSSRPLVALSDSRPQAELLTLKEAASVLLPTGRPRYAGVKTLRNRIADGTLAAEISNGRYVIRTADLEALYQSLSEFDSLLAAAKRLQQRAGGLNEAQRAVLLPVIRSVHEALSKVDQ